MSERRLHLVQSEPTYELITTLLAEFAGSNTNSVGETSIKFKVDPGSRSPVAELSDFAGLMLKVDISIITDTRGQNNFQPLDLPSYDMTEYVDE